jgi:hypothetical protein
LPPGVRGPGSLHRIIATVQSRYLLLAIGSGGTGKLAAYGRAALRPKPK